MGQPTAWPAMPRMRPKAALPGRPNGKTECAAMPPNSARGRLPSEPEPCQQGRGQERLDPKADEGQRMVRRQRQRAEQIFGHCRPALHQRPHQPAIRARVPSQPRSRGVHRTFQHDRRSVIQRVGQRQRRVYPLKAVALQGQVAEEGRGEGQRVDGRTDIVSEAGQRQLGCARPAADRGRGFDHPHRPAGARQRHRRRQPVRPCADDDGVVDIRS